MGSIQCILPIHCWAGFQQLHSLPKIAESPQDGHCWPTAAGGCHQMSCGLKTFRKLFTSVIKSTLAIVLFATGGSKNMVKIQYSNDATQTLCARVRSSLFRFPNQHTLGQLEDLAIRFSAPEPDQVQSQMPIPREAYGLHRWKTC